MDVTEIRTQIKQGIADVASIDTSEIEDSSAYVEDLGLDSLSILEIIVKLEQTYKIKLPPEQLAGFRTVGQHTKLVQQHLEAKTVSA
jgi:acyl carrier protein